MCHHNSPGQLPCPLLEVQHLRPAVRRVLLQPLPLVVEVLLGLPLPLQPLLRELLQRLGGGGRAPHGGALPAQTACTQLHSVGQVDWERDAGGTCSAARCRDTASSTCSRSLSSWTQRIHIGRST